MAEMGIHQEGLLVADDFKRMEESSWDRYIWKRNVEEVALLKKKNLQQWPIKA
jgi:hypothetical protein